MNPETNQPEISEALYFDTNALRQLSHGVENVEFLGLREFAEKLGIKIFAPEVVILEWIAYWKKETSAELNKLKSASKRLARLLQENIKYEEPNDAPNKIEQMMKIYIEEAGIQTIPIPVIALDELIKMSINKEPPFEEKSEKGFRDTIILFTILKHLEENEISSAIFITSDSIFTHYGITERFKKVGKSLSIAKNVTEARESLENQVRSYWHYVVREGNPKIRSFLTDRFDEISEYILKNAEISELFLRGGLWGQVGQKEDIPSRANIKRILEVHPLKISNIYPGRILSERELQNGIEPITFTVSTNFDLIIEEYGLEIIFASPKVKLSDLTDFDKLPRKSTSPNEQQIKVTREITMEANIVIEDDNPISLQIIKVSSY
jgi:hypothetical protein